jgi:hypothetical protein
VRWETRDGLELCTLAPRTGARLLDRPAYPPDSNPIELAFAERKAGLHAQAARTGADLRDTLEPAFRRFAPDACRNDPTAAGCDAFDPT